MDYNYDSSRLKSIFQDYREYYSKQYFAFAMTANIGDEFNKIIDFSAAPSMKNSFRLYIEKGISMGSFGNALLCGDLFEAAARVDFDNAMYIVDIANFVRYSFPSFTFGNRELVNEWIKFGGALDL